MLKIAKLLIAGLLALLVPTTMVLGQIKPESPDLNPLPKRQPVIETGKPLQPSKPNAPNQPLQVLTPAKPADPLQRVEPDGKAVSATVLPRTPLAIFNPTMKVIGTNGGQQMRPGQTATLWIELSGLAGMRNAHLYSFDAGCAFRLAPFLMGENPLVVQSNTPPRFTSDDQSQTFVAVDGSFHYKSPVRVGVPVSADGTAKFSLSGRPGMLPVAGFPPTTYDRGAIHNANAAFQAAPGAAFAPYLMEPQEVRPSTTAGCTPKALIMLQDQNGTWKVMNAQGAWQDAATTTRAKLTEAAPWFLIPHDRRTITDTWRLKELLAPTMEKANGISVSACDGNSVTPTGTYPVGIRNRAGKLAFVIRSGPFGTDCKIKTAAAQLSQGVRVVSITWKIERVNEKCYATWRSVGSTAFDMAMRVGTGVGTMVGGLAYFSLTNSTDIDFYGDKASAAAKQVIPPIAAEPHHMAYSQNYLKQTFQRPSVHGWLDPFVDALYQDRLQSVDRMVPFVAHLSCENTLFNDHEIALIIDNMVVDVPPGVNF